MIEQLHIKNFKAWRDTGRIRLAPLTVFFGPNSSGKSSISQFLLLLKQTAQFPDRKRVLYLGDKKSTIHLGTYDDMLHSGSEKSPKEKSAIHLGTYDDMLHSGSEERHMGFLFRWRLSKKMEIKDVQSDRLFYGNRLSFVCNVGPDNGQNQETVVHAMGYRLWNPKKGGKYDRTLEIGMFREETDTGQKGYELKADPFFPAPGVKNIKTLPPPTRFYGFPDEAVAYYLNIGFVRDLNLALEKQLGQIYYLGPLREFPQRSYTWSGEVPEDVGWHGNLAVNAILAARDKWISPGERNPVVNAIINSGERKRRFEAMIAYWLKEMGLIKSFEVRSVGRDYEVMVRTAGIREKVNLTDAGFGVSQVLPVLVQCFYAPPNSTLIIEQPEIHLHPSAQASLADLFIEAIQAKEGEKDRNIQLLIESHSEHFLRRLQRRIAEEKLSHKDAAIYVCHPSDSGSKLRPLEVDEYGNIANWPKEFFGDKMRDLMAMTEATIRRNPK